MKDLLKLLHGNELKGKLIAIDFDGTLGIGEGWGDEELQPNHKMISLVKELYYKQAHIIIYTARLPEMYPMIFAWLIKYKVPFHGIAMMMKCGADIYIDDKAINVTELI